MVDKEKKYKKGHFIGIGLAIGIPIGIPIGIAMGNIALGPAMGLPIGLAIGYAMESKYNPKPIELTSEEKEKQNKWSLISIGIGLLVLAAIVYLYFSKT